MRDGYVRVAAATPKIRVADCSYNTRAVLEMMDKAYQNNVKVLVFPELVLTGYTCDDLFLQDVLLEAALLGLHQIVSESLEYQGMITFVGMPFEYMGRLYNVAAVVMDGRLLALVPKSFIPNYGEFYEARHFCPGPGQPVMIKLWDEEVPFGAHILFRAKNMPQIIIGCEICEDLWTPMPPSIGHAMAGATIIINCSASNETVCKDVYRKSLVTGQSASLICGYVYCSAGEGESTQDLVFSGHNIIAENGSTIAESKRFSTGITYGDLDLFHIRSERRRMGTFEARPDSSYQYIEITIGVQDLDLKRYYEKTPFVPVNEQERTTRCEAVLSIQSFGLKKRLEYSGCKTAVIGISDALDSTLALVVAVRAFDMLKKDRRDIIAVIMPCSENTRRTYHDTAQLTRKLGITLREIDVKPSSVLNLADFSQNVANQTGGMLIGTGDLSELALGFSDTAMYGVNVSVPRTLVRHLVCYYAGTCDDKQLRSALLDILDAPVSGELFPYELHDFFMYHILRFGYEPAKIYRITRLAFRDEYDTAVILKWLKVFYRRFFSRQFQRSCLPDGPKVGSVSMSPRGDLRMPDDACAALWLSQVEDLK